MTPTVDTDLTEDFIIPLDSLGPNSSGIIYVSFTRNANEYPLGAYTNELNYVSKELDPESGEPEEEGYPDVYSLEEVDLAAADYIVPSYAAFTTEWDRLKSGATATETFSLAASDSLKGLSSLPLASWLRCSCC